ncbi:short-chain dehydrogenase/reductase-like protein SDR [Massarina eburnea CBS 473.64]|uniref:Short-chain dehydrogenase/reductase-like protein SDR n=1 Tax=Massarina eburnea CBS 473.64 TaxID=1395130 RepID=A0A6A6RK28_9PLEO|nr:short-chain dehydrogenase/reductase-like protein SDR [Massarina eburnea CBS 473.64]
MSPSQPLKILITGGARGIGRGLFRHFLSAGHSVYVIDSNPSELNHVNGQADSWRTGEATWRTMKCDLRDRQKVKQAVEDVASKFNGQLDVLINNAFATPHIWSQDRTMEDDSESVMEEWDTKIAVGLTAPFLLGRLCVPLLKAGKSTPDSPGTIINISSSRAYQSEMDHEAYSAAKAGLLGLTQSMAVSLGHRHKIRVNAIIPGWIHVENENEAADAEGVNWEKGLSDQDAEWHPAGRVGKVEDIAKAVEYLVGCGFVTGQEIVVDGGVGRKMVYPE